MLSNIKTNPSDILPVNLECNTEFEKYLQKAYSLPRENFFEEAAKALSDVFDVDYILITECCDSPATRVQTKAFVSKGEIKNNFTYPLNFTPCEKVFEGEIVFYAENIQSLFPDDMDLVNLGAVGYIAGPVRDFNGNVIGHIVAMDTRPIEFKAFYQSVLSSFALRVSREIEQLRNADMLKTLEAGYFLPLGKDFFSQLTKTISETLNVDTVIVGKLTGFESRMIETQVIYHQGAFLDPITYPLKGSPCEVVVNNKTAAYSDNIQALFPGCDTLKTVKARGYAGTTLTDASNTITGLLYVINQKPLDHADKIKSLLELFAIRTSLEQERFNSEERIRYTVGILDTTDDLMSLVDRNYIYKAVNQSYSKLFKKPISEIVGRSVLDLHGPGAFYDNTKASLDQALQGRTMSSEFVRPAKDGTVHYILGQHKPFYDADGEITGVVISATNITNLKNTQNSLTRSEQRLQSLYDDTPSTFFTINVKADITSINAYGLKELGYDLHQILGQPFRDFIVDEDQMAIDSLITQCFKEPDKVFNWEIRKTQKDGQIIWAKETARVVTNQNDEEELFVVSEDITERHQLAQELSYQAKHDSLTGLVNRREFERHLKKALDTHVGKSALCFLDLDRFKIINDACGHLAGDELLKNISGLLRRKLADDSILARLGGDEFGILAINQPMSQVLEMAEGIRQVIEDYEFIWQDRKYLIGASIGIVAIHESNISQDEIMARVDAACFLAKDQGRNRIHIFNENDADIEKHRDEMGWVGRIHEAIDHGRFELYSQKIANIKSAYSNQNCFEVLIRLIEKDKIVFPGAFLPAAERFHLATKIDEWVVSTAIDWLMKETAKGVEIDYCSINLSGHSLSNESFLQFLMSKLTDNIAVGHRICFEITETAAVANLSSATEFIEKVKTKGCTFALDDFGSGVSSFKYLKNLPVDYVKIDGAFVRDIADDPIDFAMVRSINEIAQLMGKQTIAEFVENDGILEKLKSIGVDYAQGYGIGKPQPLIQ